MSRSARYNFILIVVALSGCLAAFGGWRFAKASAPVNGPIIMVSVDSLRADRLPAYGYAKGHTPSIDALAADGVVFDRAYSHVPQTLPAHAALLTGRLPFETGVRDSVGFTLPDNTRTVAELLRDRGYATGGIVSSFLLRKGTGINRGFAFFDDERPTTDATPSALTRDGIESEQVAEHWLDSIGTSRAFLFLHIAEPHAPHVAPAHLAELDPYDGEIAYSDDVVGRLIKYLKAHQLYERATIVFVSDHGEGLGDHGEQGHGLLAFDETLRVPLIVKQPAGAGAGLRIATPVQLIDIVPTILDFAKAPGASGLRGRSLTPVLSGGSLRETPIYAESMFGQFHFGWAPITTVISGRYQLVTTGTDRHELFDLTAPPTDRRDLADAKPEVVAALVKELSEFTIYKAPLAPVPVTPGDRERFERLGYVGVAGTAEGDAAAVSPADRVAFVERFRSAVSMADAADASTAIEAYTALTREQPANADVWMHLARVAARFERHELALDAYAHVLELEPDNVAGHLGSAASNLRARKLDDAEAQATAVLDASAADAVQKAEAHEVRARVALNRRDAERARAEADAAEAADPHRPVRALVDGRLALDQQQYADAADAFKRALDAATAAHRAPLADLRVYAAEALMRVDRRADAEALLNTELSQFPANARARSVLQSLLRSGDRTKDAAALAQH